MSEAQGHMPEHRGGSEPTPWELHRSDQKILETLDRIETRMLTLAVFQEYQRGADHRAAMLEETQGVDRASASAATTAMGVRLDRVEALLSNKIEKQAERAEILETTARELKAKNWIAIGMAVLGSLLALGGAIIIKSLG